MPPIKKSETQYDISSITSEEEFVEEVFSQKGILGNILEAYEERREQKEMARQIVTSYREASIALIEAGTGTGKSFAYLVPALIWALKYKEKTVISTHTIALQEQLLEKDIPFLLKAMKRDVKVCLVKGMKNYLCLRKLKELEGEPLLIPAGEFQEFRALERWADKTEEGSKSDVAFAVTPSSWDKISADAESCSHVHCPQYKKCFFFKARQKAEDAQLLIVNHALLFADIQLRRQEKEGILPSYQRLILDEAHHIEQVALDSFTQRLDRHHLLHSLIKMYSEAHPEKSRLFLLKADLHSLSALSESLTSYCDTEIPQLISTSIQLLEKAFKHLREFLESYHGKVELDGIKLRLKPMHCGHPLWKENVVSSFNTLAKQFKSLENVLSLFCEKLEVLKELSSFSKIKNHILEIQSLSMRASQASEFLIEFVSENFDAKRIRWIEVFHSNISLFEAFLDVSTFCQEHLFSPIQSAVLCSATLTTSRTFAYTKKRLGLENDILSECVYDSPFDFSSRSLFLVPTDLPFPHEYSYFNQLIFTTERAIEITQGSVFVLFTSYDMLSQCYHSLSTGAIARKYPLLKQGDLPRHLLLEQFKKRQGSVLFATDSFWEGVDVPGDALKCVIIAKLPFPVPSDPLYEAHAEALEKEGKDAFSNYAIPLAVTKFKQGFGRLLRTKKDRGCVLCLDTRLVKKGYGKFFINSLPPSPTCFAPRDKVLEEMRDFFTRTT